MGPSAHMDEVVEAARANRDLGIVLCDLLAERRRGYLRSTAASFVESLQHPFPFFIEDVVRAPLAERVSSEQWDDTLSDLRLVSNMLAHRRQLLDGEMVRLVIDAVHRGHPDLGQAATEARERATADLARKASMLVVWMDRMAERANELSASEGTNHQIHERVTPDDLRRDLGV